MKTKLVSIVALSALALAPVYGAPKKSEAPATKKRASSPAAPATERKISAEQAGARELVARLSASQKSKMLTLLNEGSAEELAVIKGISKTRAAAIENARPFKSVDQAILVRGIGKGTMAEIVSHARSLTSTPKSTSSPSKDENS